MIQLIQLEIPAKLVRTMRKCVQKLRRKVKFNSVTSEEFSATTGLRLGDALFLI